MSMLSPQKIIPITDDAELQMQEVDQQLAGNDDIQYYSDEDSEYKDGDGPIAKSGKLRRKTYHARLQALYEEITYDRVKQFARWFVETATLDVSISVPSFSTSFADIFNNIYLML